MAEKKIVISVKSVKLKNGQAEVSITAFGTDEDKKPMKNKTAKLFLADVEKTEVETTTNDKGVAHFNFDANCVNSLPVRVEIDDFMSDKREVNTTSEYEKKKDDGKGSEQEKKKPAVTIRAYVGLPTKIGDPALGNQMWESTVRLKALQGTEVLSGELIEVRDETQKPVLNEATDANGVVIYTFRTSLKDSGKKFNFSASLTGALAATETPFEIPLPEEQKPKKLQAGYAEIKEHGKDGKYIITIEVLDVEKREGEFDYVITEDPGFGDTCILPGGTNPFDGKTDERGFAKIELVAFQEKRRTINVRILGKTDIDRKIVLNGPKQPFFKSQVLEDQGFWGNFWRK